MVGKPLSHKSVSKEGKKWLSATMCLVSRLTAWRVPWSYKRSVKNQLSRYWIASTSLIPDFFVSPPCQPHQRRAAPGPLFPLRDCPLVQWRMSLECSLRFNSFAILIFNWKSWPKQTRHLYSMENQVIFKCNLFAPPTRSCLSWLLCC